ncbi:hypothetical protein [Actinoplanes sp. NPDC049599]|uniref:hypothetical protein n=1 Tax=Actinoplanes sp. NPDC049599 TaxID=3363903 RepID=UPI0037BB3C69
MSFYRSVRRGAAFETGRRLWVWFLAFEIIRRVLPFVVILAALGVSVWFAIRSAGWWLPRLAGLATVAVLLGVAVWLYRRYRWEIRAGLPRTALAAIVLGMAGLAGAAVWWLR